MQIGSNDSIKKNEKFSIYGSRNSSSGNMNFGTDGSNSDFYSSTGDSPVQVAVHILQLIQKIK